MTRLVQDLIFLEALEFEVHPLGLAQAQAGTFSMGEVAANLCALAGLELIDYDTLRCRPVGLFVKVELMSKAWRERWQRTADFARR